jgi:excisionase family DNA binding protein
MADTGPAGEWMTATEAATRLGISKPHMARLLSRGVLEVRTSELDRRLKMVRRVDVERLASEPRGRAPKCEAVA